MDFITKDLQETKKIAIQLAKKLHKGDVVALYGELGSGKTTFTGYLVGALGVKARVQSPTFVLARKYSSPELVVNHIDLYRLTSVEEVLDIGVKELLEDKDVITVIEWPELIENLLPKSTIRINFEYQGEDEDVRKISIHNLH